MTILEDAPPVEEKADAPADAEAAPEWDKSIDLTPADRAGFRGFLDGLRGWSLLRHTPYGLLPIVLLGLVVLAQEFDTAAWQLAGPEFIRKGISIQAIIAVTQLLAFFGIGGSIYLAFKADRWNRVRMFGIGTILSGLACMCTAVKLRAFPIGGARVGDEIGSQACAVPQNALIADYYPSEARGRAFSVVATLANVGGLFSLIIAAELFKNFGLFTGFAVIGGFIALVGLAALIFMKEPVRGYFERRELGVSDAAARIEDSPLSFGEAWRASFAIETLRRFFIANGILQLVEAPFLVISALFLADKYGLDVVGRALVLTPGIVVSLIGGLYGGSLIDRLGKRSPQRVLTVFGLAYSFTIISALGYGLKPPILVLVTIIAIRHVPDGLSRVGQLSVISQVVPSNVRAQALQMQAIAALPGYLFGFTIAFIILRLYGYAAFFYYTIPFYVFGGFVLASAAPYFDSDRRRAKASSVAAQDWRLAQAAGNAKMLVCRDVDVAYDGVQVLFGVDFEVDEGDIIALLGTNGAGKSTLLRAISGTQEASNGAIVFDGREITHAPPNENARRGVINVPGGRGVFPGLTVRENLLLGTWMLDDPDEVRRRMTDVLEMFPILRDRVDASATTLSGGEQQMLSLAQAFLGKPKLLMIDELSLGLSPAVVAQLIEIVKQMHARGTTIIVVEQSVNVALSLAQRAVFMEKGEIKFDGLTADLMARPDLLRAVYVKGTGSLTDAAVPVAERNRRIAELDRARPVLEVEGLVKRFGGITAVDGVDVALRDGEVLGIIGPNGSGKTTLFELISGFQRPDQGVIRYEGIDITDLGPEERAQRRLIRRFQDARLFPSLTVFETLEIALESRHEATSVLMAAGGLPQSRRAERRIRASAERLIDLLDLGSYRDKFTKELSTGLRRIVDLGCVLAAEPKVLLLDEPSTGIAQSEAEGLAPLLRRVRFETGCSIMIIEHDIPLISAVSDELVALELGRVVVRGDANTVLNDERVIEAYLGNSGGR